MTLYSPSTPGNTPDALLVTRIYNLMTWEERDRIRIGGPRYFTLSITGFEGAPAVSYVYEIDGKPASMTDAYWLMKDAQTTGTVELVA